MSEDRLAHMRGALTDALDLMERLHGGDENLSSTEYYARRDRIRITLADEREQRDKGHGGRRVWSGPADIAWCPEHGLHGSRDTCFECGKPVEQIRMVPIKQIRERMEEEWLSEDEIAAIFEKRENEGE